MLFSWPPSFFFLWESLGGGGGAVGFAHRPRPVARFSVAAGGPPAISNISIKKNFNFEPQFLCTRPTGIDVKESRWTWQIWGPQSSAALICMCSLGLN